MTEGQTIARILILEKCAKELETIGDPDTAEVLRALKDLKVALQKPTSEKS